MIETVNFSTFCDKFQAMGRENQFSRSGKKALFDYLTDLESDTGEEIELDVIALCCDYTEYKNIKEFQKDYGDEYKTIDDIRNKTSVIMIDKESFITQQF